MSTKSQTGVRTGKTLTDPRFYPFTMAMTRQINNCVGRIGPMRGSIAVRVLDVVEGAPARFVPQEMEVDIRASIVDKTDISIAGTPEYTVKYPSEMGAIIHETCHVAFSKADIKSMYKQYGGKHTEVYMLLEEGRCESMGWPNLNEIEREALRSMVLDIVLEDVSGHEDIGEGAMAVRLVGLLAGRANTGIIDSSLPRIQRILKKTEEALGTDIYKRFFEIAVSFSKISTGYWDTGNEDRLHELVKEWLEVEKEVIDEDGEVICKMPIPGKPGKEGEGGEEGEGEPSDSKDGDSNEEGESKEGGKGGKPGGKPGEEGEDGESEGDGGESGDEDGEGKTGESKDGESKSGSEYTGGFDGKEGDGSNESNDANPGSGGALGEYGGSHLPEDDKSLSEMIEGALKDAGREVKTISGERLGEQLVAIHKANAAAHAQRRRAKHDAMRRWKEGRRG